MSFPIDYQKEVCRLADDRNEKRFVEAFLRLATDELARFRASIEVEGTRIQFQVPMFRWRSRWDFLGVVDWGSIEITQSAGQLCVTYHLRFMRTLVMHFVIVLAGTVFVTMRDQSLPFNLGVIWPALFLGGAFALGYLMSVMRFSRFIKKISARANFESIGL